MAEIPQTAQTTQTAQITESGETADAGGAAPGESAFAPVVVRSAAAQVADQIVEAIRDGRTRRHERLPAERELARQLGVSRPTVREALAGLELAGVVETRQGSGTVVVVAPSHVANWGIEVLPMQVFEARLAVEPRLAELAAQKRYPEDLQQLRATGRALEEEYERTGAYESDLPVHRAIARAARNPILADALEEALKHTESPRWSTLRAHALAPALAREGHVDEVRRVIDHIEAGSAAEAAEVWTAHLTYYRDEMLAGLKRDAPASGRPDRETG